jgi:hypothetical protein
VIDAEFSAKVRRFWSGKSPRTEFYYHESYNTGRDNRISCSLIYLFYRYIMKKRILTTLESGVVVMLWVVTGKRPVDDAGTVLLGGMCMLVQFNLIFFYFKLFFL